MSTFGWVLTIAAAWIVIECGFFYVMDKLDG